MAKQENDKKNNKHFWKDFKAELKKVIWPTKKQLTNNTMVVVAMVIVTAVIVLVLDLVFDGLNTFGINKIKEVVRTSISETVEDNTTTDEEEQNNEEATDSSEVSNEEAENNEEPNTETNAETTTEDK